jgi:hypothetical protein
MDRCSSFEPRLLAAMRSAYSDQSPPYQTFTPAPSICLTIHARLSRYRNHRPTVTAGKRQTQKRCRDNGFRLAHRHHVGMTAHAGRMYSNLANAYNSAAAGSCDLFLLPSAAVLERLTHPMLHTRNPTWPSVYQPKACVDQHTPAAPSHPDAQYANWSLL